jgi:soluble lytic murein transglycosylase-like protein
MTRAFVRITALAAALTAPVLLDVPPVPPMPAPRLEPPAGSAQKRPRRLPYDGVVQEAARLYRVSARLIHAVIFAESAYRADAVSSKGAIGLMQLMPATARGYGIDPSDPEQNIHGGAQHLRKLLDLFEENVPLALAAYNAGAGAVLRHEGIPPYPETAQYVTRVLGRYRQQADPALAAAALR